MNIYISGSLAYDRIMNFPDRFANHILPEKIHILNVCFLVQDLEEKFGGTAGNIAYSLALLQEKPTILATAGSDFDRYANWLKKHDISTQGIETRPDIPTASAYITTDHDDNQITAFNPGAMNYSTYQSNKEFAADSIAIVSPGNLEDMQNYPLKYKEMGIPYIFDPGQNIPAFSGDQLLEMITGSRMLIANDYELNLITEATNCSKEELLQRTKTIVTTLGEHGAKIEEQGRDIEVPAVKGITPADPTGAGDAFRSGLIKGLCMGKDLEEAAKLGAICASFSIEHKGTQDHSFNMEQFWQRYKENF